MSDLIIYIWLSTGVIASGPVSIADCDRHVLTAQAAVASGGYAEFETPAQRTLIVRLQCGGHDIVLALPTSNGDCEMEAGS